MSILNRDLVVGTKVFLKPDSQYVLTGCPNLNPLNTEGTVAVVNTDAGVGYVMIAWSTRGDTVWYAGNTSDFITATKIKEYNSRAEAREAAKELGMVVVDLGKDSTPRWTVGVKEV